MYEVNDFKKGLKILLDGEPYVVVDFQHVKPGKGNQFTRSKLRNLITKANFERTFKSGERFGIPDVESREMQFLYKDESGYHFMDQVRFEQLALMEDEVGDNKNFLVEETPCHILFFNERAIGLDIPNTIPLRVKHTEPGLKGNTVSNTTKPATLETDFVLQVPLHINEGDILKVDTRTGEYLNRMES